MSMIEMTIDEVKKISGATASIPVRDFWQQNPWYASIDPLTGEITFGHGEKYQPNNKLFS